MPRQRTSMPARRPSDTSSSSRASFHTAHETRGSVYPGMQARASGGNESELPRNSRNGLSDIIEIARHDDGSETSRRPSRRHPGILPWISDAGESDSGYGSRTGRSYPSQTGLSDYSTNSLEPWDSISNQGSNPSDSIYIPPNLSLRRYCRTHRCYSEDDNCDPRRCTYFMTTGSDVRIEPRYLVGIIYMLMNQCLRSSEHLTPTARSQETKTTRVNFLTPAMKGPGPRGAMVAVTRAFLMMMVTGNPQPHEATATAA